MLLMSDEKEKYHLVGVAGVGMSALAGALLATGSAVSGSDRYYDEGEKLPILRQLERMGVTFYPQDGSGITKDLTAVVVTTAISGEDCPDEVAAKKLGVPIIHRSEMLAKLMIGFETIAITGTCGKSTITGLIGHLLTELGENPFVVNGAPIINWQQEDWIGNIRAGQKYFVFEADESDKSLLNYQPDWVVITNASRDHHTLAETTELFDTFLAKAKRGSVSVVHDPEILTAFAPVIDSGESHFTYKNINFTVPLPGRHNAENAFIAILTLEKLGFSLEKIAPTLKTFRGIYRRLEKHGLAGGVTVYDDYAHNPAKIEAAILAIRPVNNKIIIIWRPHSYSVLRKLFTEFTDSFAKNIRPDDKLIILPVYDVGGVADRSLNGDQLVVELVRKNVPAEFIEKVDGSLEQAVSPARPGDVIVTMGARDPHLPEYADKILTRLNESQIVRR